jgi:hypothetical protein
LVMVPVAVVPMVISAIWARSRRPPCQGDEGFVSLDDDVAVDGDVMVCLSPGAGRERSRCSGSRSRYRAPWPCSTGVR